MVGAGEARRPGADDGDLFGLGLHQGRREAGHVGRIGREALQRADGHRLVQFGPAALGLAGMRADPAQDPGQRQARHDELQGFFVLAQFDELHVALDVDLRRAGEGAGGPVQLHDAEGRRDGLGIEAVGRLPVGQPLVELIRHGHRADIGAFAAAGALGRVHIAGLLAQGDLEVPRLAAEGLHLG